MASLASHQLDAFLELARAQSFTVAARNLHVTQSALSQRIRLLEDELECTLFFRDPGAARLTPVGEELLRYCQAREKLEREFRGRVNVDEGKQGQLSGALRIASFSTLQRSVLQPALAKLLRENPNVEFELMSLELRELPTALRTGRADLIFTSRDPARSGVESKIVGFEENVLVEPVSLKSLRNDCYLDHDAEDTTTQDFWSLQKKKAPATYMRSYLDEIYSILDGVEQGLGRAVVPRHLLKARSALRAVKGFEPLRVPVYMCFYKQAVYSKLFREALSLLEREITRALKA